MGMTAESLRKSILQYAVEGKLTPQNPEDEPASVLIDRNKGTTRKKNITSTICRHSDNHFYESVDGKEQNIDDEISFEIPQSWEWVRLGTVVSVLGGKRIPAGRKLTTTDTGHLYIRVSDMKNHSVRMDSLMYVPEDIYPSISRYIINKEDVYITVAGTIGYVGKIPEQLDGANLTENADRLVFQGINQDWLIKYLSSPFIQKQITDATTKVGQPKLAIKRIENLLIALPPLAEQDRIVEKLDEYELLLREYECLEDEISVLDENIHDKLWKSILQYAIEGKLIPQNSEDESASVLLKKIYDKREANINKRLVKNGAHEFRIYRKGESYFEFAAGKERCIDNEIPFEIPDNWQWTKLGYISNYDATKEKVNSRDINANSWELDLEDIEKGGRLIVKKTAEEKGAIGDKTVFHKGDILYSKLRPYLLKIMLAQDDGICTPEIVPFSVYGGIDSEYIVYYLKSPYVDSYINGITYGVKMPRVGTKTMVNLYVPIPPYEEQKRIVDEIEKYESLLGGLSELV